MKKLGRPTASTTIRPTIPERRAGHVDRRHASTTARECEDPRIELTVEGGPANPATGLVGHLSPATARRLARRARYRVTRDR